MSRTRRALPEKTEESCAVFGTASLSDFLGDFVIYRSLVPADPRLPPLDALRPHLGIGDGAPPRKVDPGYGRAVAEILRRARALDLPGTPLERLILIGDARLSDGAAFAHLCEGGGWAGRAFIGRDECGAPLRLKTEGFVCSANRWSALDEYLDRLEKRERFALDERTVLVVDIDKTSVGARGRNDRPIDGARVEAMRRVADGFRIRNFSAAAFQATHDALKHTEFHAFTADNQDCLAYVCLAVGAGLYSPEGLLHEVRRGDLRCFRDFIERVHDRRDLLLGAGLDRIHDDVRSGALAGDPTPFKAFRLEEYRATAERFCALPAGDLAAALERRIFVTEEVRRAAHRLRERGVLLFGLSDKPDEASFPTPDLARSGLMPLHRLETLSVGERRA